MLDTVAPQMIKIDHPAPFMTFTFEVAEEWKTRVPEVVHEDGTSVPRCSSANTTRATTT
jgi:carbamoyltransferase